jgi:rod shape-determining protein MreC
MLITDPEFAAGVISQKSQAHGTVKGQGTPMCKVDYVPSEDKVEAGEWFYTSGDDRIFPRGFAVGVAKVARPAQPFKEILVEPSALQHGSVEDVLIIVQGAHQAIPDTPPVAQPVYIAPPAPAPQPSEQPSNSAPAAGTSTSATPPPPTGTEADKLRAIYKSVGESQNHNYGEGPPGSKPPDFTHLPGSPLPPPPPAAPKGASGVAGAGGVRGPEARPAGTAAGSAPQGAAGATPPISTTPESRPAGTTGPAVPKGAPATSAPKGPTGAAPPSPAQKGPGGNPR